MAAHFRIEGASDFRQQLRDLPPRVTTEATEIVHAAGDNAAQAIREAYPPGDLRDGMRVTYRDAPWHPKVMVENVSHLSNWYENGTEERHTKLGRRRGRMPPAHVFVPRVIQARRRMETVLIELLARHGVQVG
jgi:hypothetical protein